MTKIISKKLLYSKKIRKINSFFTEYKMSENIVNVKKNFMLMKNQLLLIDLDKIVTSEKFKHNDKDSKYFIGYTDDNIIRPVNIILPQMSKYIRYFDDDKKNMSFEIEDDNIFVKHNEIWKENFKNSNIKYLNQPIYEEKNIKTKEKTFNDIISTVF